jgi:RNA-binding protein YhbY
MPIRLGVRLAPTFHSLVLVSPEARIDRPKKLDTSAVIKAEMLKAEIDKRIDSEGVMSALGSVARMVSAETLQDIGRQLIALHRPLQLNYAARFGIPDKPVIATGPKRPSESVVAAVQASACASEDSVAFLCRHCNSDKVSIQYGKFGYYFKCADCDGNTPIRIGCGKDGHKERIRKDGRHFYRECADCNTSSHFYTNLA